MRQLKAPSVTSRTSLDYQIIDVSGTRYIHLPNGYSLGGNIIEIIGYKTFDAMDEYTDSWALPSEYEDVIVDGACAGILNSLANTLSDNEAKRITERANQYSMRFETTRNPKGGF